MKSQELAKNGEVIVVRYYDHIIYHDVADIESMKPVIRESIGWFEAEENNFIRLVWERFAEPSVNEQSKIRSTGLALRKSDIIEICRFEKTLSTLKAPSGSRGRVLRFPDGIRKTRPRQQEFKQ